MTIVLYDSVKTGEHLLYAIKSFEERYKHRPTKIVISEKQAAALKTFVTGFDIPITTGVPGNTPPPEHAFLYIK